MAVTSIWPIKGRVDQVINYARNPEKTTEQVHGGLAAMHSVEGVVEYVADDMKTEHRSYVTFLNCRESDGSDAVLMENLKKRKSPYIFLAFVRSLKRKTDRSGYRPGPL